MQGECIGRLPVPNKQGFTPTFWDFGVSGSGVPSLLSLLWGVYMIFPRATSEGFSFSRSSAGAEMSFPPGTGWSGFEFPRGLILCAGAVDESP